MHTALRRFTSPKATANRARCFSRTFSEWTREATYVGGVHVPFESELLVEVPDPSVVRPAFRILDELGRQAPGTSFPQFTEEFVKRLYVPMVRLQVMDQVLYEAQRQGRISFYMTTSGEEGLNIGSSSGLDPNDTIFAQYREAGVLLWRGFTVQNFVDQCFSNVDDSGKGRQMPIHYGSSRFKFHTISSTLTTQLPQATGAAYAEKLAKSSSIVVAYFGEGAASEGDFHPAMNFAAVLECPVLFICRNNGYAISTSVKDQYHGDGIVSRASGYGMASVRVDGNDALAVHYAVSEARRFVRENQRPVLLEAMSYRQGHHSTSDDSTRYREIDEIEHWKNHSHPITRLRLFMEANGWWDEAQETALRTEERKGVLEAVKVGEAKEKPEAIANLFDDVYSEITPDLIEQRESLRKLMAKYPDHYTLD